MPKLMLMPAGMGGFSCDGQDLEQTEMAAGVIVVEVPDEHVAAAMDHGLKDYEAEVARMDAEAEAAAKAAEAAAAALKALKGKA